ncbi:MAG: hypothetical protein ACR5LD_09980 [Symbiopectobacterium sp.]
MRKLTAILVASTLTFGAAGGYCACERCLKGHGHEVRMMKVEACMMKGEFGGPRGRHA